MSKSKYRPKNWYGVVKRGVKSDNHLFRNANRSYCYNCKKNIEIYEEIAEPIIKEYSDPWNYD